MRTELRGLYLALSNKHSNGRSFWAQGGGVEKTWVEEDWSKHRDILNEFNRLVDELD